MRKIKAGKIIFYRDGEKIELPLTYSEIKQENPAIRESLLSKAEAKFLGIKEGHNLSFSESKYRHQVAERGFSIIRLMPYIRENKIIPNQYIMSISIAPDISKEDAGKIKSIVRKIQRENSGNLLDEEIFVYDRKKHGIDYYYNRKINSQSEGEISYNKALESFLRYKAGTMSAQDKEMFEKYFKFDLRSLMMEDTSNLCVSNRNEGVIIITNDGKRYGSTKKKEMHKYEARAMLREIFNEDIEDMNLDQLVEKYNVVLIRMYKADRNALVTYCPQNMTEKQLTELIACLKEIEGINNEIVGKGGKEMLAAIDGNNNFKADYTSNERIGDVEKRLEAYKRKLSKKGIKSQIIENITGVVKFFKQQRREMNTNERE